MWGMWGGGWDKWGGWGMCGYMWGGGWDKWVCGGYVGMWEVGYMGMCGVCGEVEGMWINKETLATHSQDNDSQDNDKDQQEIGQSLLLL